MALIDSILGAIGTFLDANERRQVRQLLQQYGQRGLDYADRNIGEQHDSLRMLLENAARQMRFSEASRVDPYGNRTRYDPATNQWSYDLTPMQQALLNASQNEQFANLTTDAARARDNRGLQFAQNRDIVTGNRGILAGNARQQAMNNAINNYIRETMQQNRGAFATNERRDALNRDIEGSVRDVLDANQDTLTQNEQIRDLNRDAMDETRRTFAENEQIQSDNTGIRRANNRIRARMGNIGDDAAEDYARVRSEYENTRPASEASIRDTISRLMAQAAGDEDRAFDEYQRRDLSRRGSNTPIVVSGSVRPPGIGSSIAARMLEARRQGANEYQNRSAAHESKYAPILQRLIQQQGLGQGAPMQLGQQTQITGNQGLQSAPVGMIGDRGTISPGVSTQGPSQLLTGVNIPGGSDTTGTAVNNLNSSMGSMADAIAKAMGAEASGINSGYGRINQAYGNYTNSIRNMLAGLLPGTRQNDFASMGKALGNVFGNIPGLGSLFGGSGAAGVDKFGDPEALFAGAF